ncbi:MAG: hypothetical protein ACE5EA_08355 [Nitrospirota bacterium]
MGKAKYRTQVSIEDWQYHLLIDISRKTKKSLSCVIRELITEKFSNYITADIKKDPLFDIIGIGSGDGFPVGREHDKLLYKKRKKV